MEYIFIIGIALVLFIVLREVVLWYFKVNRVVSLMEEMLKELRKESTDQLN